MLDEGEWVVAVALVSLGLMLLIGVAVLLLITVHSRKVRHRADLAELKLTHDREVMDAERE